MNFLLTGEKWIKLNIFFVWNKSMVHKYRNRSAESHGIYSFKGSIREKR